MGKKHEFRGFLWIDSGCYAFYVYCPWADRVYLLTCCDKDCEEELRCPGCDEPLELKVKIIAELIEKKRGGRHEGEAQG